MPVRRRQLFRPPPGFDFDLGAGRNVIPPGRVVPISQLLQPRRYQGLGGPSIRGSNEVTAFPMPSGTPGNPVSPYNESDQVWGGPSGMTVTAPLDPSTPVAPAAAAGPSSSDGISVPFGQSFAAWHNPSTFQTVPLTAATPTNVPVLSLNLQRNGLLIQNGSAATAPDTAPILYIGFDSPPIIGFALALSPGTALNLVGSGIVFDIVCPRNSIYIAFGPSAGATVVTRGAVTQSTYVAS